MGENERNIEKQLNYLTICDRAIEYYNNLALRFARERRAEDKETYEEQVAMSNVKYYTSLKEKMLLVLLQDYEFLNYANSFNIPKEGINQEEALPNVL